jgi:hypothetical protein
MCDFVFRGADSQITPAKIKKLLRKATAATNHSYMMDTFHEYIETDNIP